MSDATRLLRGLEEYIVALERHVAILREQGHLLETTWYQTRDIYQGHGAEVFADAFGRAGQMLTAYQEAAQAILPILRDRIESLRRFDNPADPSP